MSRLNMDAGEVAKLGKLIDTASRDNSVATGLQNLGEQLEDFVNRLNGLMVRFEVVRETPALVDRMAHFEATSEFTEVVQAMQTLATTAASGLLQEPTYENTFKRLRKGVDLWIQSLSGLNQVWKDYVKDRYQPMDSSLLLALEKCGYQTEVNALRQLESNLFVFREQSPVNREQAEYFEKKVDEYKQRVEAIDAPPFVRAFLKLVVASASGASLASLTDEVRAWLDQRKLTDNFRVVIGRGA
jgi:hypothetical protein